MPKRVVVSKNYVLPDMHSGLTIGVEQVGRRKYTVITSSGSAFPILLPNRTGLIQTHFEGSRFVISDGYTRQKKGVSDG